MIVKPYLDKEPVVAGAFLAEDATVIGDVTLGAQSSIWYGTVLRGDVDKITIGARTSIQDNSVVHCATGMPTVIGNDCVVGHNAVLHSCTVEDGCLIGMGAVLLDGCHIGKGSIVAAGSVVSPGKIIPPGSMVMGLPGKVVRELTEKDLEPIAWSVQHYIDFGKNQLVEMER